MNKGYIKVSNDIYKGDMNIMAGIFSFFRPLRIEQEVWAHDDWVIYGESERFEPLPKGKQIPRYNITVKDLGDSCYEYTVESY